MSSDDAYGTFLEQANQNAGATATTRPKVASTKAVDADVPDSLRKIEQYYTSDADEPFEPVSLKWSGTNMASENDLKDLIEHQSEVSTLGIHDFDPTGQYKQVIQAVEKVGDGRARIFRVHHGQTRVEYYVVGLDHEGGRIVGLKVKAVES